MGILPVSCVLVLPEDRRARLTPGNGVAVHCERPWVLGLPEEKQTVLVITEPSLWPLCHVFKGVISSWYSQGWPSTPYVVQDDLDLIFLPLLPKLGCVHPHRWLCGCGDGSQGFFLLLHAKEVLHQLS